MPFTMTLNEDAFVPDARCDHCGRPVPGDTGLVLWSLSSGAGMAGDRPVLLACGEGCAEALAGGQAHGELAGVALDAYLTSLLHTLGIDPAAVLEREARARALEQTRDQAPE